MPLQIKYEPNETCVLRISGILKRSEFGAEEKALAGHIDSGSNPCLLVILENLKAGRAARIGMIWIFMSRTGAKFPRSPSSLSDVGRLSHLLLQERESVARR